MRMAGSMGSNEISMIIHGDLLRISSGFHKQKKKMPQRLEIIEHMARILSDEHPGKTVFRILLGAFLAGRNDDSANPKL